jgi:hypothetical protein
VHFAAKPGSDKFPNPGGLHSTGGAAIGIRDPRGAVLANIKKASDAGITGDPSKMDLHAAGKSASKAMAMGKTEGTNPEFLRKANAVRQHLSSDEAAITTFGASSQQKAKQLADFQKQARAELARAYDAAQEVSQRLERNRSVLAETVRKSGDKAVFRNLRERQIGIRVSNQATINELARHDPALVKQVTGIDPRTPAGREKLAASSQRTAAYAAKPYPKPAWNAPVQGPGRAKAAVSKWGGKALSGLGALDAGLSAYEREREDAIREGRDPSKMRAAGQMLKDALWGATGIPTIISMVGRAAELRDEELNKADVEHGGKHWGVAARFKALGRMVGEIANLDTGSQIAKEEMEREERQARAAGREPSYLRSTLNGFARGIGSVTGIARIADCMSRDWGAEQSEADQGRLQRAWAQARFKEGMRAAAALQENLTAAAASGDPADPGRLDRIKAANDRYAQTRQALLATTQAMRRRFGAQDPQAEAFYGAIKDLPNPAALTEELNRQAQELSRQAQEPAGAAVTKTDFGNPLRTLLSDVDAGARRAESAGQGRREMLDGQTQAAQWADDSPSSEFEFHPQASPGTPFDELFSDGSSEGGGQASGQKSSPLPKRTRAKTDVGL